jgi:hypothetical protein
MFIIIKLGLLVILVKLLMQVDRPFLCAEIYTGAIFLLSLGLEYPLAAAAIDAVIRLGLSLIYYCLLSRYEDSGLIWWIILLLGFPLSFV